jgi:hypothetical protein
MTDVEVQQSYKMLSPEDQAAITAAIAERVEAAKEKLKTG